VHDPSEASAPAREHRFEDLRSAASPPSRGIPDSSRGLFLLPGARGACWPVADSGCWPRRREAAPTREWTGEHPPTRGGGASVRRPTGRSRGSTRTAEPAADRASGPMAGLTGFLAALPAGLLLLAVFLLPALEASTLLGVVVPGETAVLLGGVVAHQGSLSLWAVMVAAVLGAVLGDTAGYALGAHLGPRLGTRMTGRRAEQVQRAQGFVRRHGAPAVFLGRWVPVLRALVPVVAGGSGMPYRSFALYNVAGGAVWGVAVAGLGYVLAAAYGRAMQVLGLAGAAVVAAMALVAVVVVLVRRHRRGDDRGTGDATLLGPTDRPDPDHPDR
jgi:membrane-associated protein